MAMPCVRDKEITELTVHQATMAEKLTNIEKKVDSIDGKLTKFIDSADEKYVHSDRFKLVERVVYGMIAVILFAVLGAIIRLVMISGGN